MQVRFEARRNGGWPPATFIFGFPGWVAWNRPFIIALDGRGPDSHPGRVLSQHEKREHARRLDRTCRWSNSRRGFAHRSVDAHRSAAYRPVSNRHWLVPAAGARSQFVRLNPIGGADRHCYHRHHLPGAWRLLARWASVRPTRNYHSTAIRRVTPGWAKSTTIGLYSSGPTVVLKITSISG